jgi:sulfate transport system ATP-binding protein
MANSYIEVKNINKKFGSFYAVNDVSFTIEKGKLIGLLGPSGGGKTTILRILAGLEYADSGDIYFDGQRVNDVLPQDRGIGFVFQNYALFRHMTVFQNIAFGLEVKKWPKQKVKERVFELIELTGLSGLENRLPHQLSGGQRQRVAFARALAPQPSLLLLDEPFAAIDAKVRKELRSWLSETIAKIGITSIFVTHDQDEAVEVANEILIINQGKLEQMGSPIEIYKNPHTPFVASFIGHSTIIENFHELKGFDHEIGSTRAVVRPEFMDLGKPGEINFASAAQKAVVKNVFFRGSNWEIEVQVGNHIFYAFRSLEKEQLRVGDEVLLLIHRMYAFNENQTVIIENRLKEDPMPVII